MADSYERQTAHPCQIVDALSGEYVKKEGWESNYIKSSRGNLTRVNIVAVVVEKDDQQIMLDDGSGRITARTFDNPEALEKVAIGNVVLVIGKVREYNDARYLLIEIIKVVSPAWAKYRQALLEKVFVASTNKKSSPAVIVKETILANPKDSVIALIRKYDKGEGVSVDELCKQIPNVNTVLEELMKDGEVYEVKPGIVRVLEI